MEQTEHWKEKLTPEQRRKYKTKKTSTGVRITCTRCQAYDVVPDPLEAIRVHEQEGCGF